MILRNYYSAMNRIGRLMIAVGIGLFCAPHDAIGKTDDSQWTGSIEISTPNIRMVVSAEKEGTLKTDFLGLADDYEQWKAAADKRFRPQSAMPTFGTDDITTLIALQVSHADGSQATELVAVRYAATPLADSDIHAFTLADRLHPFEITVFYRAFHNVDIIETWTEITHREPQTVVLNRMDSGVLTLPRGAAWLSHIHGAWANEGRLVEERLTDGIKSIVNTDGARNSQASVPALLLSSGEEKPQENSGLTVGATLAWSGNYELRIASAEGENHQIAFGINPQASHYRLESNDTLTTPRMIFAISREGRGGISREFHRWSRDGRQIHRGWNVGDVLLNSWEGVYFETEEKTLKAMIDDAAAMGCELFVVDDGWFGSAFTRDNSSALGDWTVDRRKLPDGLQPLIRRAQRRGMKFGIWIEPEAVNTRSRLFETHPEWVLGAKGQTLRYGRGNTQLLLDMTNPEVQQFVVGIVDNLMTDYPDIAYIKWDANVQLYNYGSTYLPADRQQNIYIDYHKGLETVMKTLRSKYPDLVIQACASGGGRANYGLLPYFDEYWASDNNDALERIKKQYAASLFFPANAIATHIGSSPDHTTGRQLPIKFRADVAMNGRMGLELQPKQMTREEKQQVSRAINDYKQLRDIIQRGVQYRLLSPFSNDSFAATLYAGDGGDAVLLAYKTTDDEQPASLHLSLCGLNAAADYLIEEKNINISGETSSLNGTIYSGNDLIRNGITIDMTGGYSSRVFLLKKK